LALIFGLEQVMLGKQESAAVAMMQPEGNSIPLQQEEEKQSLRCSAES